MILIADDNAIMRRMIRALIDDLDPDVVECADGAAAVELYEAHRPAWVLMDFSMRPTDGLTATIAILARFPGARIAIVTDYDDDETRRHAFEAGAAAFVGKDDLLPLRAIVGDRDRELPATE